MVAPVDTQPNQPTYSKRALHDMEFERKRTEHEKFTFWAVIWTLMAFKIGTIAMIWYFAKGSDEATGYIAVTSWYWLLIPILAVSGGVAYRWRLHKTRKRAAALRKAELLEDYWADCHEEHPLTEEERERLSALKRADLPADDRL